MTIVSMWEGRVGRSGVRSHGHDVDVWRKWLGALFPTNGSSLALTSQALFALVERKGWAVSVALKVLLKPPKPLEMILTLCADAYGEYNVVNLEDGEENMVLADDEERSPHA